jgi:hypothetical protein
MSLRRSFAIVGTEFRSLELVGVVKIKQLVDAWRMTSVQERMVCTIVCILALLAANPTNNLDILVYLLCSGE